MAILRFDKKEDFVNRFTLHPSRSFTSSSDGTTTGSVKLTPFPIRTRVDLDDGSTFQQGTRKSIRTDALAAGINAIAYDETDATYTYFEHMSSSDSITDPVSVVEALDAVKSLSNYGPDLKTFNITRFTPYLETVSLPSFDGSSTYVLSVSSTGSYRKDSIRKQMFRHNAGIFRKCDWAYSNAHTINFFTASSVEANCAIIYPDPTGSDGTAKYRPDAGFTFEFYINPRYTTDSELAEFNAGTILQYSSAYALSLVSGSSKAVDGTPDGFRLLLQLSSSAGMSPSNIVMDAAPSTGRLLVFSSSDNSLTKNTWHHVAVRWGGLDVQEGTGSFVIDGEVDTSFVIPSASITAPPGETTFVGIDYNQDANALFIGNYYDRRSAAGGPGVANFFNSNASTNEGVLEIEGAYGTLSDDPIAFGFTNKLNAELHELRIFKEYRDIDQINKFKDIGFSESQFEIEKSGSLALYVPPFFVMEAPAQKHFDQLFSLSSTPLTQSTPFNVTMSFNTEGFVSNSSNFFRDFVTKRYPRFFNLTGSTSLTADDRHINDQLRDDPAMNARNFLILPNDNGNFSPSYTLLKTGTFTNTPTTSSLLRRFVNDRSITDLSIISLNRMLDGRRTKKQPFSDVGGSLYEPTYPSVTREGTPEFDEAFYNDRSHETTPAAEGTTDWSEVLGSATVVGSLWKENILFDVDGLTRAQSPSTPNSSIKNFYVFESTGDESSNQAAFFNVSNIFYGKGIKPGTLTIKDGDLTLHGTTPPVAMTLKDDGFGSLYRTDSSTPNKLHSVGNVFYNDGIIAIKSPHLFSFGSGSFSVDFQGTQDVINRELLIEAPKNLLNTSLNPTYQKLAPTDDANETADEFVYITTVLLHDEDLNVIGRATLSEPIVKRTTDAITFRLKKDF